jgi:hypothetical protein
MGYSNSSKRLSDADLYVNPDDRPGWPTGANRVPEVGEEVYCAQGEGTVARVCGKTSDGSRLLELQLKDPKAKPFFAAASNVLVTPRKAARKRGAA